MKSNPYPGFFVAIEGLDGSGADEIAQLLATELKKQSLPVVAVKEPSGSAIGKIIKELLLKEKRPISPLLLEFLFAADRAMLMEEEVIPALKKGKIVISDRSLWSSIAYRSLDLPHHWLLEVNASFTVPDVTFFIDVSPAACAAKIKKGEDKIQVYIEEEKLKLIREGYYWVMGKFPHWFRSVDGERKRQPIVEAILSQLQLNPKFINLRQ